eukprot:c13179_g1_i1.p2 GENE.c13179_g1_i1~~c13179_g1_i1.p2  ORF type:complete len:112 (+),score=38.59 c13179_g1_i1:547-882(+)
MCVCPIFDFNNHFPQTPSSNNNVLMLTKGDHNSVDDRGLYPEGSKWLAKHDIVGKVNAVLPHVGVTTILLNDFPLLKHGLVLMSVVVASKLAQDKMLVKVNLMLLVCVCAI